MRSAYGVLQRSSQYPENIGHCPGSGPLRLGGYQPAGRVRQRQPRRQEPGHQTAHGRWWRRPDRHQTDPSSGWSLRITPMQGLLDKI